ncbi:MAG: N-acetyltransferase [Desulfuromonas sp.]|nr:MAG: N-acetyltransferase [Desulfuromonas sp.]
MAVTIRILSGDAVREYLDDLASLRLEIFAEFPYLYQGKRADELAYLTSYAETDGARVILAEADGEVIGAATGMPLQHEDALLRDPVATSGADINRLYYVGELLFYRRWRGARLGQQLLATMEEKIRRLGGFDGIVCATVARPTDHPQRPADFIPIERFLARTGFAAIPGASTRFAWRELDGVKREQTMLLWRKAL